MHLSLDLLAAGIYLFHYFSPGGNQPDKKKNQKKTRDIFLQTPSIFFFLISFFFFSSSFWKKKIFIYLFLWMVAMEGLGLCLRSSSRTPALGGRGADVGSPAS